MRGQSRLSQGYVELRLALGRGVRTDIIGFDLSLITMVISAGLCLGRTENAALIAYISINTFAILGFDNTAKLLHRSVFDCVVRHVTVYNTNNLITCIFWT